MTLKTALFYERYELKYHIPLDLVEPICEFLTPYCEMDHFSKISPDDYYSINNIYLDTPNFLFLERRLAGVDERFNMRVRTYGDELTDDSLYLLEVKNKSKGFVRKTRAKVKDMSWFDHLDKGTYPETEESVIVNDFAYDFFAKAHAYRARPVAFTQYRRKALFSTIDDYARITFDKQLRYCERDTYDFSRKGLKYYDNANYFDPYTSVILELKCETKVPMWFLDIIRRFNLSRSSFSKFVFAIGEIMETKLPNLSFDARESLY
ncbi:polyphosphate polymerase domain-containing protein [Bacteriovoracaceae bacterium]|nr:polyphosphate polymerase domain-containing protein [Bacteriovoracaceae bacterium]